MAIKINNLIKSFGQPPTTILKGISADFEDGTFLSITGRSGSGKSTLLYLISSLDKPTSGTIEIDSKNIASLNSQELHRFRNEKMGFVFQFHYLLPELSALENVLMPAIKTRSENERRPHALELLKEFGIADKANRLPNQLSGGEQQRVAIARALVMQPKYIFADEPTGNLDSANGLAVIELFKKINLQHKTNVIMVTHDPEFARMAAKTMHLVDGAVASITTN